MQIRAGFVWARDALWRVLTAVKPADQRLVDGPWAYWPDGPVKRGFQWLGVWIDRVIVVVLVGVLLPSVFVAGLLATILRIFG